MRSILDAWTHGVSRRKLVQQAVSGAGCLVCLASQPSLAQAQSSDDPSHRHAPVITWVVTGTPGNYTVSLAWRQVQEGETGSMYYPPSVPDRTAIYMSGNETGGQWLELAEQETDTGTYEKAGLTGNHYRFMVCFMWNDNDSRCEETGDLYLPGIAPTPLPSTKEAPTIESVETYPPNFKEPGKIVVHWYASRSWGFYNVIWRDAHTEVIGGQDEIHSGGSTGSYTFAPAEPGRTYKFKVEGCDGQPFGPSICGNWSDFREVPAAAPLQSVRSFFAAAGVDPSGGMGLRSWLNGLPHKGNPWSLKSLLRGDYL